MLRFNSLPHGLTDRSNHCDNKMGFKNRNENSADFRHNKSQTKDGQTLGLRNNKTSPFLWRGFGGASI